MSNVLRISAIVALVGCGAPASDVRTSPAGAQGGPTGPVAYDGCWRYAWEAPYTVTTWTLPSGPVGVVNTRTRRPLGLAVPALRLLEFADGPHLVPRPFGTLTRTDGGLGLVATADDDGDGIDELFAVADGRIAVIDAEGRVTREVSVPTGVDLDVTTQFEVVDLDRDGRLDLLLRTPTDFFVLDGRGTLRLAARQANLRAFTVAQLDNDPAYEVVLSDGAVLDGALGRVQAKFPMKEFAAADAVDVDGDGLDEVVAWDQNLLWMVAGGEVLWSHRLAWRRGTEGIAPRLVAERGTGAPSEVMIYIDKGLDAALDGYLPVVLVFDASTGRVMHRAPVRHVPPGTNRSNPWQANFVFSLDDAMGGSFFHVAGPAVRRVDPDLGTLVSGGVFVGSAGTTGQQVHSAMDVRHGDLDGDGRFEVVAHGYQFGHAVIVYDADTWEVLGSLATSDDIPTQCDRPSSTLADLDGDGGQELVTLGFDASNRAVLRRIQWSRTAGFAVEDLGGNPALSAARNCSGRHTMAAVDLDGDDDDDLVVQSNESTVLQLVADPGALTPLGPLPRVRIYDTGDLDGDGETEIVGRSSTGALVVMDPRTGAIEATLRTVVRDESGGCVVRLPTGQLAAFVSDPFGDSTVHVLTPAGAYSTTTVSAPGVMVGRCGVVGTELFYSDAGNAVRALDLNTRTTRWVRQEARNEGHFAFTGGDEAWIAGEDGVRVLAPTSRVTSQCSQ